MTDVTQKTKVPVWPDLDTIYKSMNNRMSLYSRPADDPLFGVSITDDMINRAREYDEWDRARKNAEGQS